MCHARLGHSVAKNARVPLTGAACSGSANDRPGPLVHFGERAKLVSRSISSPEPKVLQKPLGGLTSSTLPGSGKRKGKKWGISKAEDGFVVDRHSFGFLRLVTAQHIL